MPRTTTVHLLQGDYPDRLARLASAAEAALDDKTPLTALEQHPYTALEAEYRDLKAEAIADGITVNLAALGRSAWRRLKEKHPPRVASESVSEDTARGDSIAGVNTDAVEDDLVFETVKAWQEHAGESVDTRATFEEWAERLSEGEWQVLVIRAWELANGARLDPKDLPVLRMGNDD